MSKFRPTASLLAGIGALVAATLLSVLAFAEFKVPPMTGPVVDTAGVIDPATSQALDRALRALHDHGGSQIAVLTVASLGGLPLEAASIAVTDQWKLGNHKVDRGVLLMVAVAEKKIRIEAGYGNEGLLTDADSKQIIDDAMSPLFRKGDMSGGILVGVFKIAQKTDPGFDLAPYLQARSVSSGDTESQGSGFGRIGMIFIFILIFLFLSRGRRGGSGLLYAIGWGLLSGGGGLGGGGGDRGGSWSGGGGGFGGGGASGGW